MVRFLCWHVLKLEFWHFPHPELNFASAFASVFAVFYSKKVSQPPGCTVQKRVDLCISHRFFRCFPVCVAFRIGFYSVFADSRLFAHASLDLHLSFSSVRGWGGGMGGEMGGGMGGGVMTSMRMRLVSSVSFVALILERCRLLCEALVAASRCLTFETSTMQKPRVFEALQTKTSKLTLKVNTNQRRKARYLRHFRKNPHQQKRTNNY